MLLGALQWFESLAGHFELHFKLIMYSSITHFQTLTPLQFEDLNVFPFLCNAAFRIRMFQKDKHKALAVHIHATAYLVNHSNH